MNAVVRLVLSFSPLVCSTPRYRDEVVKLKHGMCWLEGDNWRVSADSNYYGPVGG